MQLEQMYQEIILDHYRKPVNRGLREPFDAQVHHVNPTCGDECTLRVQLSGHGRTRWCPTSRTRPSVARSARHRRR